MEYQLSASNSFHSPPNLNINKNLSHTQNSYLVIKRNSRIKQIDTRIENNVVYTVHIARSIDLVVDYETKYNISEAFDVDIQY